MTFMLWEVLPEPDEVELGRIRFMTKVDLVIALGQIPARLRAMFKWLDGARNHYAHDPDAALGPERVNEGRSALAIWAPDLRAEFKSVLAAEMLELHLRTLVGIMYDAVRRRRDELIRTDQARRRLQSSIERLRASGTPVIHSAQAIQDEEDAVKRSRDERAALGEP